MPDPTRTLRDALSSTAAIGATEPGIYIGEKLGQLGGKIRDAVSSVSQRFRTLSTPRRTTDIRLPARRSTRSVRGRR